MTFTARHKNNCTIGLSALHAAVFRGKGTPGCAGCRGSRQWIIPTGVGNTLLIPAVGYRCTDHPHGCGEHERFIRHTSARFGSSPRVWGTRHIHRRRKRQPRIIPTGVGNTAQPRCCAPPQPDHPHGCGEHGYSKKKQPATPGSSPRVWGTLAEHCCPKCGFRIIPTGVGNTASRGRNSAPNPDHPHGCGEH